MKFSKNQLLNLKIVTLCSKIFFHNFDFEYSKRLVPQFNSCASSSKNLDIKWPILTVQTEHTHKLDDDIFVNFK
jgi:hypothetical protein